MTNHSHAKFDADPKSDLGYKTSKKCPARYYFFPFEI